RALPQSFAEALRSPCMRIPCLLAAALAVSLPSGLFAGFTVAGKATPPEAEATARLYREDIDARTRSLAAEFSVGADGAFRVAVEEEAGLFTLSLPGDASISLAIAEGQTVQVAADPAAFQGFRVDGSPDTEQ